ncbi:MAG: hypothetical protein A3J93_04990 [Candidatus Magasanikbacteria bacterium RIFOXYC2_FULL_42_28]|uniref:Orotidine 5'-phosphate decarboxylase domain-containing protein n=1 Tax=Candidatus Magasanikbacteria bacterium RIFOXYC2_FULL_42_28 TaxID=1798704 RepID=A0A1F6NUY9_9BACT|nr:MAG: hypothetical protein A3J93_04990 [Candidatus Magasanikbacteria bacterium RIFOXYC2_FULL_42_28]
MPFDWGEIFSGALRLLFWVFVIYSFSKKKKRKISINIDEANSPAETITLQEQLSKIKSGKIYSGLVGMIVGQLNPKILDTEPNAVAVVSAKSVGLDSKKRYLQVALNGNWEDAQQILRQLPNSERILIEAGTPFIKRYGINIITEIRMLRPLAYIVADLKTVDMGEREANLAADVGANAVIGLGIAPVETINALSEACTKRGLDMFLDLMNVEQPLVVLKQLDKLPKVVLLHRGVDETETDSAKTIPYFQINQIKGAYKIMVAVAGADSERDVKSAVFNGADIVVLWKSFYKFEGNVGQLAERFLAEIR